MSLFFLQERKGIPRYFRNLGNRKNPAGNGNKIILSGSGGFERRRNDTLLFKGNYSLHHKQDCYSRESDIVITTNEQNNSELYITIENGKLIFDTPNCYTDGALTYYIKQ